MDEDDGALQSMSLDNAPDTAMYPAWKRDLYSLLEQPTSSQSAFLVYILTTGLIILSAIVTVTETVESLHYVSPRLWFGLETSLVALFTVEYTARCVAWSGSWKSLLKWIICAYIIQCPEYCANFARGTAFYGIIDLLAILPYYIEVLLRQDMV
jgi:hypothetical protein